MEITRPLPDKTVRIETLEIGDVFYRPSDPESFYMIIDQDDYFLDDTKITDGIIIVVDIEEGGMYSIHCNEEVVEVRGSFVISKN